LEVEIRQTARIHRSPENHALMPDCKPPRQRLIGDYIGAVAVPGRLWVDFVLPVGGPGSTQRVYVAAITTS
jgi:hypothetical protein